MAETEARLAAFTAAEDAIKTFLDDMADRYGTEIAELAASSWVLDDDKEEKEAPADDDTLILGCAADFSNGRLIQLFKELGDDLARRYQYTP